MSPLLLVIENPEESPLVFDGIESVAARTYLTDDSFTTLKGAKIFNICRSYRYQSIGYYVSLLAEARGHKPVPSITTIQDMKLVGMIKLSSDEMAELLQKQLAGETEAKLSFNIYFGRTLDKRFEPIGSRLFKSFPAPFLRADLSRNSGWHLQNVSPLPVKDIPPGELALAEEASAASFAGRKVSVSRPPLTRYDLAILHDPEEKHPPSNPRALKRFMKAANSLGIGTELITKDDAKRLSEFDGLFIRETTNVDHHTYRIARRAVAEGLVVIDEPLSIMRCSNKVFLAELLARHRIPTPRTIIVHSKNLDQVPAELSLPCILKQPDSSFSQGVILVSTWESFQAEARNLLRKSDLFIAQEYLPTDFDWRIGILDRRPLFACKYFMAKKHWQIVGKDKNGRIVEGRVETLPVGQAPKTVVRTALKAANLIGDGLYGVDLKEVDKRILVIEVNDNPSIDTGCEDDVLKDDLYRQIMQVFLEKIEALKKGNKKA